MTLLFPFADVEQELQAITALAKPFFPEDEMYKLEVFKIQLRAIHQSRAKGIWHLPEENPLRTRACEGQYEVSGGGRKQVRGEVSALWEITPVKERRQKLPPTNFQITGKASTKLRLVDLNGVREEMTLWRLEIGDDASPGAFFHIQLGEDDPGEPLHMPLPVPRIPCPPVTPMLAIEYLLAELFQTEWQANLSKQSEQVGKWRNLQLPRFERFLGWQQEELKGRTGSPVTDLKLARPQPDLLLDDKARHRLRRP